jgi:hypothetical protein
MKQLPEHGYIFESGFGRELQVPLGLKCCSLGELPTEHNILEATKRTWRTHPSVIHLA